MTRARTEIVSIDYPGTYHLLTRRERLLDQGERKVSFNAGICC